MNRQITLALTALMLCLAVPFAQAAPPAKGAERKPEPGKPKSEPNKSEPGKSKSESERNKSEPGKTSSNAPHGNSAPGGSWSEPTHNSGKGPSQTGAHPGATSVNNAGRKNSNSNASGAEGAAAATAASNRNSPKASGAEGVAAGAAAANRNAPKATGAEGAAAGAAAANRNSPKATGAEGAAAGAAVANRNSPQASGTEGAALGAAAVRNSYNNPNLYNTKWYAANPNAWAPTGQGSAAVWVPTTYAAVADHCGAATTPVAYNYGTNVTCDDGNVTLDGKQLGTAAEFSQQAAALAQKGAVAETSDTDEWLPLGVYAMVRNEQQHPQLIVQLAVNKQGILRGNYTDELSEHTQTIQGAVDPKSQRAAWTVGDNTLSVVEAGLSNLSQDEAPVLIHRRGQTDHWLLVRLNQPDQEPNAATDSGKPQ